MAASLAEARASRAKAEGFALAALLVAIAVLSVMLLVALPAWRHQAQREKEIELIFRGEQYARAIGLYRRKLAGAFPPSLDVLVEQKFVRRKYKDPITGDDFEPVFANSSAGQSLMQQGTGPGLGVSRVETVSPDGSRRITATFRSPAEAQSGRGRTGGPGVGGPGGPQTQLSGAAGGVVGVRSKSTGEAIVLYNGRDRHDQWIFTYLSVQGQQQPQVVPDQGRGAPGLPGRGSQLPGRGQDR